jgi:hypothetical protein
VVSHLEITLENDLLVVLNGTFKLDSKLSAIGSISRSFSIDLAQELSASLFKSYGANELTSSVGVNFQGGWAIVLVRDSKHARFLLLGSQEGANLGETLALIISMSIIVNHVQVINTSIVHFKMVLGVTLPHD